MNPRDFLKVATKLSKSDTTAEYRTAISRAYYAAYNVGVELLEGMGCPISKSAVGHEQLSSNFNNSEDIELSKISTQLNDLRSKRNIADYRLERTEIENQKNSQAIVMQAEKMIKFLDRSITGPRRDKIAKSINEYRKRIGH